jgi:hypothetical protein
LNCIKSLRKIDCPIPLKCYCIGKEGYKILQDNNIECSLLDDESNSNFQTFRTGNWSNITFNKFIIIHENLLQHEYVLFTDGDIVFEDVQFYEYLVKNIGNNDMLIQTEHYFDNVCSGFMFIKSNPLTQSLFNPSNVEQFKDTVGWGDQIYINSIKDKLNYEVLPPTLFPTGKYYYDNHTVLRPYMVHFNWAVGHDKKALMKHYNKWFL